MGVADARVASAAIEEGTVDKIMGVAVWITGVRDGTKVGGA